MKPGKGYSANHCSHLEYRGTFMVLGQENTGASVMETECLVCPRRCAHPRCTLAPQGPLPWEVALWSPTFYR